MIINLFLVIKTFICKNVCITVDISVSFDVNNIHK